MDAAVPMTATGLALIWPLLGFLFIWMILFGVLAFRPERAKQNTHEGAMLQAGGVHPPSAPAMLHIISTPSAPGSTLAPRNAANVVGTISSSDHDFSNAD
jgi:hypothetical protein